MLGGKCYSDKGKAMRQHKVVRQQIGECLTALEEEVTFGQLRTNIMEDGTT